jgi:myb proto-oncogene protein
MELYEDSPSSSEHSTGSTVLPHSAAENLEHSLHQDNGTEQKSIQIEDQKGVGGCDQVVLSSVTVDQGKIIKSSDKKYQCFKNKTKLTSSAVGLAVGLFPVTLHSG